MASEAEATVVDGNDTEAGHIVVTTIGGRNGQPKQICRALAYIHDSIGGCHRDIKPQKLLPLFPDESGVDQLVEIFKILGTLTREEIKCINLNYIEFKFPQMKAHL